MPRAALVSKADAVRVLKKFYNLGQLSFEPLSAWSHDVWGAISKELEGKWASHNVYHNVKHDLRDIRTTAQLELGLIEEPKAEVTEIDTEISMESDDSAEESCGSAVWFDLTLTSQEWNLIKPADKVETGGEKQKLKSVSSRKRITLQPHVWTNVIAIAFATQTKLPCAFIFKEAYVSNRAKNYLTINGHCKSKACNNTFHGILENRPSADEKVTIRVKTRDTRQEVHDLVKRPLNGQHREKVQNELIIEGCSNWKKRQARENMEIDEAVPPFIYSSDVLRQAKKERADSNLGVDPLDREDLLLAIRKIGARPEFQGLQLVTGDKPFFVFYHTPIQTHIYKQYAHIMKTKAKIIIDTTGSLVRKIKRTDGTMTGHIFLTTIVINFENKTVPVYQMLSESQVTEFIVFWIKQWIRQKIPIPPETVSDYSRALLSALCLGFNNVTIKAYANDCFLSLKNGNPIEDVTRIRIDVAHLIHFVSRWKCFGSCKHREVKEFYIRCVARMIEATTLAEFEEIFTLTCAVAGQAYADSAVEGRVAITVVEARKRLENIIASQKHVEQKFDINKSWVAQSVDEDAEFTDADEERSSNKNAIQAWIDAIVSNSTGTRCVGSEINAFYIPDFVISVTRLAKEFPLWTAVLTPDRSNRASSAFVESYFNDLKTNVLKRKIYRVDAFMLIHLRDIAGGGLCFSGKLTHWEKQEATRVANTNRFEDSDLMSIDNWKGKIDDKANLDFAYPFESEHEKTDDFKNTSQLIHSTIIEDHSYSKIDVRKLSSSFEERIPPNQTESYTSGCEVSVAGDMPVLASSSPLSSTANNLDKLNHGNPIVQVKKTTLASFDPSLLISTVDNLDELKNGNPIVQVKKTALASFDPSLLISTVDDLEKLNPGNPVNNVEVKKSVRVAKKSKYFPSFPEIRQMNNRIVQKNVRHQKVLLLINGNLLPTPVMIDRNYYFTRNTCAFDSLAHMLMVAAIDYPHYSAILDNSDNPTVNFVAKLLNGSKDTYVARTELLKSLYISKVAAIMGNRITYSIDAEDSMANVVRATMESVPSRRAIQKCSRCCGREIVFPALVVNHKTICNQGFSALENALDLRRCLFKLPCRDGCNGTITETNHLNLHLLIELDVRRDVSQTKGMRCMLRQLPKELKFQSHNEAMDIYRLVGIVVRLPGHFVTYCLRVHGVWELYDDLQNTVVANQPPEKQVEPHLAFYVREHNAN